MLSPVFPMNYHEFVDSLKRDRDPQKELIIWERLAASIIRCRDELDMSGEKLVDAFITLFNYSLAGSVPSDGYRSLSKTDVIAVFSTAFSFADPTSSSHDP